MNKRLYKAYKAHYEGQGRKMPEILENEIMPGRARWRLYQ